MAATDTHADFTKSASGPFFHAAAVTPHDTNELGNVSCGITVQVAGVITVVTQGDDTVALGIAAGVMMPLRVKIIKATGTTATGISILY